MHAEWQPATVSRRGLLADLSCSFLLSLRIFIGLGILLLCLVIRLARVFPFFLLLLALLFFVLLLHSRYFLFQLLFLLGLKCGLINDWRTEAGVLEVAWADIEEVLAECEQVVF